MGYLALHWMQRSGVGAQWRIQGKRMPNPSLVAKAVQHNALTDMVLYWAVSYIFSKLLLLGKNNNKAEDENQAEKDPQTDPKPQGWSGLRFGGPLPSWTTHVWQVAVGYIGYDAMFYWSHRLLHHKSIYKLCHKQHHEFHTPIAPSASHEHVGESITQLFNWYLPIGCWLLEWGAALEYAVLV